MKLRTIVADDEPLARERLRHMLSHDCDVDVVAECRNGKETITQLKSETADLLFLDVQMPGGSGFDVIDEIGARHMPPTVFVTAYEEFAVKAFAVHAVDYLTKPIEQQRLSETLVRVKDRIAGNLARLTHEQMSEALSALRGSTAHRERPWQERFLIHDGSKDTLVPVNDVEWIEAADYYCCLHVGNRKYMLRESIKDLSTKLDPTQFVRIHRSIIVRIGQVREIHRDGRTDYFVVLVNGERLKMSKAGWKNLITANGAA